MSNSHPMPAYRPNASPPPPAHLPAMPKWAERAGTMALAQGTVGAVEANAKTYIANAYVQGAGLLTSQALMLSGQLSELEADAIARAPWAEARIRAIGDAFAQAAIQEIVNLRDGGR